MHKQIKMITAFFLTAAMTAGLAGCSSPSSDSTQTTQAGQPAQTNQADQTSQAPEESKSTDKVDITLAVWTSSSAAALEEAQNTFNNSQDKINFKVEIQADDYAQYLGAKTVANDLPDLFYLNP